MKKEQIIKILQVAIISTVIIFIAEAIFSIPAVNNWFSGFITNSSGFLVWIAIWIIMFLQVTILNIPAYVILSACASIAAIEILSVPYILVVLSAYMCGCLLAYWLGYKFGKKAVKWCAGSDEDYEKWSKVLNKKGKMWYFLTVMFPFFPDDLLCLVAGAVKFDFVWYAVANLIGRGIGLITMILVLKFIGFVSGDFPIMLIVWAVALIAELVFYFVIKSKYKKEASIDTKENKKPETTETENLTAEKTENKTEEKEKTKITADNKKQQKKQK